MGYLLVGQLVLWVGQLVLWVGYLLVGQLVLWVCQRDTNILKSFGYVSCRILPKNL